MLRELDILLGLVNQEWYLPAIEAREAGEQAEASGVFARRVMAPAGVPPVTRRGSARRAFWTRWLGLS